MKKTTLIFTLALVSILSITGCKHKGVGVTDIPGMHGPSATGPGLDNGTKLPEPKMSETGLSQTGTDTGPYAETFTTGTADRNTFAADTVYFDTDSAVVRKDDRAKLEDVANHFKNNSTKEALIIEGNCDERGTEQYNLSLGDKRALAVREYLAQLGVDPVRMKTVTNGEAKPVDPGHSESAWKKNRRAELVLMLPK
jgi:peptidoglycan-associated lipoprotein